MKTFKFLSFLIITNGFFFLSVSNAENPPAPSPNFSRQPVVHPSSLQQAPVVNPATLEEPKPKSASGYTYAEIHKAYSQGNLTQAKQMAMAHLIQYPADVDVQYILGAIYYREKNFSEAQTILNRALKTSPKYDDIRTLLIRTNLAQGNYTNALKLANDGLALKPNNKDFMDLKEKSLSAINAKNQPVKPIAEAAPPPPPAPPAITYDDIRKAFDAGNISQAENMAENYLQKYPEDLDVRYLLARIYLQENKSDLANQQLQLILAKNPKYSDARMSLVNQQITAKDYGNALNNVNTALQYDPNNESFLFKKAVIYSLQGDNQGAKKILQGILIKDPSNTQAMALYDAIINTPPLYGHGKSTIGFLQNLSHDSITGELWDYSSLYYGYNSDYGYIQANANYANRLGEGGPQALIEAYPVINQDIYLDVKAGYANNPSIFPDYLAGAEAYALLPANISLSLGDTYNDVTGSTYFNTYTGSLAKFFGNNSQYWLSFRPYHFVPNAGPESTLYTGSIRRYFGSPDFFLNLTFGGGHSPDLTDLQTVDFIKVKDNLYNASLQFPIAEHTLVALIGINYETLQYPSGTVRDLFGGTFGLSYRLE